MSAILSEDSFQALLYLKMSGNADVLEIKKWNMIKEDSVLETVVVSEYV